MSDAFWRNLWKSIADPGHEDGLPAMPQGVRVQLGEYGPIPVDVEFRGRTDGIDHWAAVVPWPRGTPLPPGPVTVMIDEVPGRCQVNVQVRWT